MSGIAGVLCNDSARYSLFWTCWNRMSIPEGWEQRALIGGDWCGARTSLCEETLESGAEHLFFMDDDHAFAPDLLLRLLRWERKLVTPLCLMRSAPFNVVSFDGNIEEGDPPIRHRLDLSEHEPQGLVELTAGGTAGMLIHRDVLEVLDPPWFEYGFISEDLLFCDKAIAAGFTLHCDMSARLGHITTAVVEPAFHDGQWVTGVTLGSYSATTGVLLPLEASSPSEKVMA
jgi:hypothetical protein